MMFQGTHQKLFTYKPQFQGQPLQSERFYILHPRKNISVFSITSGIPAFRRYSSLNVSLTLTVTTRIRQITTRISENATRIRQIATRIGQYATRIRQNATRIGQNATRIGQNATRIGKIATRIGKVATRIGKVATRIGLIATRILPMRVSIGRVSSCIVSETDYNDNRSHVFSGRTDSLAVVTYLFGTILFCFYRGLWFSVCPLLVKINYSKILCSNQSNYKFKNVKP
jgi:hypothetical protein